MTDPNKEFAELAGIDMPRYEHICPVCHKTSDKKMTYLSVDFSNPVEVLRVMREREDWYEFYQYLNQPSCPDWVELILTTGLLRDEAIRWMEGRMSQS